MPWLLTIALVVAGCGGSTKGTPQAENDAAPTMDGSAPTEHDAMPPPARDNSVPVIVQAGPPGVMTFNVAYLTMTICVPGTTTCQTIDGVQLDTGSSGVRVISSVLNADIALPQEKASTGDPLGECVPFASGPSWGSVRLADVKVGGEVASSIPVQIIGDPALATVPQECSNTGMVMDTVPDFGANAIIGINQIVSDCGEPCATSVPEEPGVYFACAGGTCTNVGVAVTDQLTNPIAKFADNNGAMIEFPAIPAGGAPTATGTLTFGIGTASNNALGNAKVLTTDVDGNFTTVFSGMTFPTSFIDSGTSLLAFNDSSITECMGGFAFCPTSTVNLTAMNQGLNGATSSVSFSIMDASMLTMANTAFDDIGAPGLDNRSFDWGLPFFFGKTVYVALEGASTPGGPGGYYAY
jgi:hypothetical protein